MRTCSRASSRCASNFSLRRKLLPPALALILVPSSVTRSSVTSPSALSMPSTCTNKSSKAALFSERKPDSVRWLIVSRPHSHSNPGSNAHCRSSRSDSQHRRYATTFAGDQSKPVADLETLKDWSQLQCTNVPRLRNTVTESLGRFLHSFQTGRFHVFCLDRGKLEGAGMQIEYEISEQDFIDAQRLAIKNSSARVLRWLFPLFGLAMLPFLVNAAIEQGVPC